MRENDRNCERAGSAESFPPKNFINEQKVFLTVSFLWSFINNTQYKITKISKQALLQWGQNKENQKGTKVKKSKINMNSAGNLNSAQG